MGIFGTATLHRCDISVATGDRFFLFSDGLIESSPGGGRQEGLARLIDACVRHRAEPLAEATVRTACEICPFERMVEDDLLLLAVEVRP